VAERAERSAEEREAARLERERRRAVTPPDPDTDGEQPIEYDDGVQELPPRGRGIGDQAACAPEHHNNAASSSGVVTGA
jgi:hypothetical protein